ncbi:histone-like nucleoid-structuring protein Lsr2 [Streptomyces sp900105245]|uniref:Histone-like nucleoid-structuring protein Lsr2 n=1 Tax=Streptomyces sp. 900105245 TaxID=3154379 RepID=A0ABV1UMJ5_9ACTN
MTGHHNSCPVETISGMSCSCKCHIVSHIGEDSRLQEAFEELERVDFSLDGKAYEILLSRQEASALRTALAPFTRVARHLASN